MIMKIETTLKGFEGIFCFGYVDENGNYVHYFDEFSNEVKI
jgi:hypothetical protein